MTDAEKIESLQKENETLKEKIEYLVKILDAMKARARTARGAVEWIDDKLDELILAE